MKKKDDTLAWSTRHMERSARSRLERGREAEKEERRKGKRLLRVNAWPINIERDIGRISRCNKINFTQKLINFVKITYATWKISSYY